MIKKGKAGLRDHFDALFVMKKLSEVDKLKAIILNHD